MNDFTKEELKQIGDALFYGMAILHGRKDALMEIRGKVLEMIDNYCEHDPKESSISYTNYFCTKCGKEIA